MADMYDFVTGVLDFTNKLVLEVDEDGLVVGCVEGEFPTLSDDSPYRFGVICHDTQGNRILVTTDLDFETLEAEIINQHEVGSWAGKPIRTSFQAPEGFAEILPRFRE